MGTSIREQMHTFATAALLGAVLALLYDLLRALRRYRRENRALTGYLDACYCAVLFASGLAFALHSGSGEFRLYALVAAACGGWSYAALFSPVLRPLWDFWARAFFQFLYLLQLPLQTLWRWERNFYKTGRRLFLFYRRSCIIGSYRRYAFRVKRTVQRGRRPRYDTRKKGEKTRPSFADSTALVAVDPHGLPTDGDE